MRTDVVQLVLEISYGLVDGGFMHLLVSLFGVGDRLVLDLRSLVSVELVLLFADQLGFKG